MIISIEGLPGVGKTTAAGRLAELLEAGTVRETTADHPFLGQVYEEADRDDLTVELAFLLVHANAYRRINRADLTVCDFSPVKDQLFAEDMLSGPDLSFFRDAYRFIYQGHPPPDLVVFLRAEPELCLERVRSRLKRDEGRGFEGSLTLERLERMRVRYDTAITRLADGSVVYDVERDRDEDQVARDLAGLLVPLVPAR